MRLLAFDVETAGIKQEYALQPHRSLTGKAWLTTCSWAWRKDDQIRTGGKIRPCVMDLRSILKVAKDGGMHVVAWNAPFDVAWLIALGLRDEAYATRWIDGMLLWKHLIARPDFATKDGKRQAFGLKEAVKHFYPDEAGYEDEVDFNAATPEGIAKLLTYNKSDSAFTLRLTEHFLAELTPEQRRAALIEARTIPHVAETLVEGLPVNTLNSVTLRRKLKLVRKLSFTRLHIENGVTEKQLDSPQQLSELLFNTWGLPVIKQTEKGANSTDKDALSELAEKDPRAKLVRDFREARNLTTKFCDAVIESARYNGPHCGGQRVVRPAARMYGTYTGRMTYSGSQGKGKAKVPTGIALHQWKRQAEFRRTFTAPEGYDLCEFDFAGQEFRWMAVESGDNTMLDLCAPGEDAHAYMGGRVARIDYQDMLRRLRDGDPEIKPKRQIGKVANLSLQYRTSPGTLLVRARTDYSIKLTLPEAQAIHGTYQLTYRGVPEYWHRQIHKARHQGYVATLGGRRVQLGFGNEWPRAKRWSYESTAINFPIQGVGADQKYLAMCVIGDHLPKWGARFAFELHDGLFFYVPKQHSERAVHDIRTILSNLPYEKAWGIKLPIAFPVDAKIGPSWGDLKEVH